MSTPFLGQIIRFGGNFAPRGWAFCDGQLLPIAQNTALFSLLGTTYGGDGRTTFALPNLQGRVPIHPGTGPGLATYKLGQKGGQENVVLTTDQIPSHNHLVECVSSEGNHTSPDGAIPGSETAASVDFWSDADSNGTMRSDMIKNGGGGQSHNNMQPYLVVNYIIALQGTYPSRS